MNWLRKMMYGRYGSDQLNIFLLFVSIIISVLSWILPMGAFGYLSLVPLILCIFRMFSKNIAVRQRENMKFLTFWYKLRTGVKSIPAKLQDRKYYRYFSCPKCTQKVRVPKGKGKINIKCPKCGEKFIRKS